MTTINAYIKYSPSLIDVSSDVIDRVDIWRKATDGVGRFNLKIKNDSGEWLGSFSPDDPIQIKINGAIFFEGYLDKGFPLAKAGVDTYQQLYELVGRDYGQDLQNKLVDKTGDWMYKTQYADDILDHMLSTVSSEIVFTPTGDHKYPTSTGSLIPQIQYTDLGDEYLIEAFRKIMERIDYDFYIDDGKTLQISQIGIYDSGIVLQNTAGSVNNVLDLRKTEFDVFELRNYVIAKSSDIEDGWTDENADAYTGASGNTVSNENTIVQKGISSIRSTRGSHERLCELHLSFPRYNYEYLPFDVFGKDDLVFWLYVDREPVWGEYPTVRVILEDDQGLKIVWPIHASDIDYFPGQVWKQYALPIGSEVAVDNYESNIRPNDEHEWLYYEDPSGGTFNWKIVKITWYADGAGVSVPVNNLYLDGLRLPFPMIAYAQDGTSQSNYKVRHIPILSKDIRTQKELDAFATGELAKTKDPIEGLKVTATGTSGIIGGVCKWVPGWCVKVNSPGDNINNAWYRMAEIHSIVAEEPIMKGHDFIVELILVPHTDVISGKRLGYAESEDSALLRGLSDRIRYLEKMEEASSDWFPGIPEPLGDKIRIGDFLTLEECGVKFTRHWEENELTLDDSVTIVDDSIASGGRAAKMASSTGDIHEPIDSPHIEGQLAGDLYAIFCMKVASNASSSNIATLRVVASSAVSGSCGISPNDFPVSNKYHHFAVRGRVEEDASNAYADVYKFVGGITDLYLDYIAILPANIPLGYSDVTVLEENPGAVGETVDPGSTGDLVDTGSTGDTVDPGTATSSYGTGWTMLGNSDMGNQVDVGDGPEWTEVQSLATSPPSNKQAVTVVQIDWERGESGGDERVQFRLQVAGVTWHTWFEDIGGNIPEGITQIFLRLLPVTSPWVLSARCHASGGDVWIKGQIKVLQSPTHTHPVIGDSHATPISGDSHTTPISGDSHGTVISGDEHSHNETEGGHEH